MSSFPCPKCAGTTTVKDSRAAPNNSVRRRRHCLGCGERLTTYELALDGAFMFAPALTGLVEQAKAIVATAERIQDHANFMQDMEDKRYGGAAANRQPTQTPQE